jgi:hypothetical protein
MVLDKPGWHRIQSLEDIDWEGALSLCLRVFAVTVFSRA